MAFALSTVRLMAQTVGGSYQRFRGNDHRGQNVNRSDDAIMRLLGFAYSCEAKLY